MVEGSIPSPSLYGSHSCVLGLQRVPNAQSPQQPPSAATYAPVSATWSAAATAASPAWLAEQELPKKRLATASVAMKRDDRGSSFGVSDWDDSWL
jgi:hypothetical protein